MIGSTVSHYEILERLGGGGMGVVYKARDPRLDRFVALKFLSPHRDDEEARRRFLREARAASALDHPNICTIHEIGETEDGRLFIAMAFCEGETLEQRIGRGPLPVAEAVDLALQIAEGLAEAHAKGILHRDVKPANVLVTAGGRARLVDFGLARLAGESRLTQAGTVVGTAAYMSPEQLRGEETDGRTDIWSLGVVLYRMLTGHLPFRGESETDLVHAILVRGPEPLSGVRPDVPRAVGRIVSKVLAKRPEERHPSMADLAAALRGAAGPETSRIGDESTLLDSPWEPVSGGTHGPGGMAGRVVGSYRLLELLGGGGMGVVYKAEDVRLSRPVALKLLPPGLTSDPEAKARFLQEARAASSLDHPNVCTILEVGETGDGQLYLAMPCYEGETLRSRIGRGPLPLDEAVDIARQVALGLAKAHRRGIVHRDVKPANLVVTEDGVVKILDFGLAKLAGSAGLTRAGATLGTPAYMSPEQAWGEEVDPRTDLWSLGAVLYEMLTGRRPFPGEQEQGVLYRIFNEEPPPLASLRPEAPPELARIVGRLLAKRPADRYPGAEELIADLRRLQGEPPSGGIAAEKASGAGWSGGHLWKWGAFAILAALAVFGGLFLFSRSSARPEPVRATFTRLTAEPGMETFPSLSPGGDYFVYARATSPRNLDVYLRRVGGDNPINLTADSPVDDIQPAYSPDGQQIAFRSEREGGGIFVMGATGESVRRLTDFGYNPAWSPNGREIVIATESTSGTPWVRQPFKSQLWRIDAASGSRRPIRTDDAVQPSWSPGGHRIAYWRILPGSSKRAIWTVPAGGGEAAPVTRGEHLDWNPVWAPGGDWLYFVSDRGGSLNVWRLRVDETSGAVRGEPEPVTTPSPSSGWLSFSRDGERMAYATREGGSNLLKYRFDPVSGKVGQGPASVLQAAKAIRSAAVSPDGRSIAFDVSFPQEDLFIVHPDGSGLRQLTRDVYKDRLPRWSPDGSQLLFFSNRGGSYEAWAIRADGGSLRQLTQVGGLVSPMWYPDGKRLVVGVGPQFAASWIDLEGPLERRVPRPFPLVAGEVFGATALSPDGRWIAGGTAPPGGEYRSSTVVCSIEPWSCETLMEKGSEAVWLNDGRRLLYLDEGRVFLIDREEKRTREVLSAPSSSAFSWLSLSRDGKSLYALQTTDEGDVWMTDFNR